MTDILLDVKHLTYDYKLEKSHVIRAVDDISFQIRKGEIFGLVGESGSGKSTVARCVMNILKPDNRMSRNKAKAYSAGVQDKDNPKLYSAGIQNRNTPNSDSCTILYKGVDIWNPKEFKENKKMLQTSRQIIFQDSASSLNQRMKVADIIAEPMQIHHLKPQRGSLRKEAEFQLHYVGMDKVYMDKYPYELSGGMRQRVAIARALSMEPELLVADEPIAALDVSIQAQIINLLKHCNKEHNCSMLFIAHDLSVVRYLCDRVGVMYQGKLVELAPTKELFANPIHPYSQTLLSAIPIPDPRKERARIYKEFDAQSFVRNEELTEVSPGHLVMKGNENK